MAPKASDTTVTDAIISSELEMGAIPAPAPSIKADDAFLVVFAQPYDADNPRDWSTGRKWAVTDGVYESPLCGQILVYQSADVPDGSSLRHRLQQNHGLDHHGTSPLNHCQRAGHDFLRVRNGSLHLPPRNRLRSACDRSTIGGLW